MVRSVVIGIVLCAVVGGAEAQKAHNKLGYSAEYVLMWRKAHEALKDKNYRLAVLYYDFLWHKTRNAGARVKLAEAYRGRFHVLERERHMLAAQLATLEQRLRRTGYPLHASKQVKILAPLRVQRLRHRITQTRRRLNAARAGLGKTRRLARCARNPRCNLLKRRGANYVVPARCLRNPRCKLAPAKPVKGCDRAACSLNNSRPCCARFRQRRQR